MLKKTILALALLIPIGIVFSLKGLSYTDGNPPGCSGSPTDQQHCATNCHNEKNTIIKEEKGWIKSNIPETGYIPDSIYTITLTAYGEPSATKFGFEASPQYATGKTAGKMIVTNAVEMKLVGGIKYITQIAGGVDGKGSRTWSFKWKAPVKGSGKLTFYGAFLIGGKPETAVTSSLEVNEKN